MGTHTSFHHRLLHTHGGGHVAYDIALRLTSGYLPHVWEDPRLNQSVYARVAQSVWGEALGTALKHKLVNGVGECASDPRAFMCHPFARPTHWKRALGEALSLIHI